MALNNSCTFVGHLTADPEVRKAGESEVCNFSIGINEYGGKDKDNIVTFVNLVAWNHSANYLGKYAKKGDLIIVTARYRVDKYEKDGKTQYAPKFIVDEVKSVNASPGTGSPDHSAKPTTYAKPRNDQPAALASSDGDFTNTGPLLDISSGDLPF